MSRRRSTNREKSPADQEAESEDDDRLDWYLALLICQAISVLAVTAWLSANVAIMPGVVPQVFGLTRRELLVETALSLVSYVPGLVSAFVLTIALFGGYRKYQDTVLLGRYWYRGYQQTRHPAPITEQSEVLDQLVASTTAEPESTHRGDRDD